MPTFDLSAHTEISSWKQEAKEEDNARYFFPMPEADKLRSGEASFLFERKGKGKTAVGQSILIQRREGDLATSLSFKNYPFNDLYQALRDNSYRAPNQYIAGWRFVIFCTVARLMADDATVGGKKRRFVRYAFSADVREALSTRIGRWVAGNVQFNAWGVGLGLGAKRQFMNTSRSLAERADLLYEFLVPDLGRSGSRYYVVFDELDEDFTSSASPAERDEYFALLTSLLKAVWHIRSDSTLKNVYPIVLLRDDIFTLLRDNDREKWMDRAVDLNWSQQRLKELLAFRLCRAAGVESKFPFDEVWSELVGDHSSFTIGNKTWDKFDFISSYTMQRPRDFIYYISDASRRICQKYANGAKSAVLSGDVLRGCVGPFAEHLRRELEDEMGGQLPYIHDVMDIILNFGDRHFKLKEFRLAYETARQEQHEQWPHSAETVLDLLYSFSAIGFVRGSTEYYRYQAPHVDLDLARTMLLHKGLTAARRPVA
jgi:hypothetical protein